MGTQTMQRLSYCTINAPSKIDAAFKCFLRESYLLRPSGQRLTYAVKFQHTIIALILSLLIARSPFHVSRFVMSIVINPFYGVFTRWFAPKFSQELFERFIEKLNSPSAVVCKCVGISGVLTPITSATKSAKLWSGCTISRLAVCSTISALKNSLTTTRFSMRSSQVFSLNFCNFAAPALAPPFSTTFERPGITQYQQPLKTSMGQIDEVGVGWERFEDYVIFGIGHDVFSYLENVLARLWDSLKRFSEPFLIITQLEVQR